jgi:hypothetical protein
MSKNNNKYILKYNQEGDLYNYVELNRANKVISYFKIEDKNLIRFDRGSQTKQLIKFKQNVKLKQKFIAGESFVTVFDSKTEECVQYKMPDRDKQITLVKNNVLLSDFGKFVVEKWKKIKDINKENGFEDVEAISYGNFSKSLLTPPSDIFGHKAM